MRKIHIAMWHDCVVLCRGPARLVSRIVCSVKGVYTVTYPISFSLFTKPFHHAVG